MLGFRLHKLMILLDNSLRKLKITNPTTKLVDFQQGFKRYLQTHPLRKEESEEFAKGDKSVWVFGFL